MVAKNDIYIGSLIDYINDIKPYHCKITEIIETFNFSDNINVSVTDKDKWSVHLGSTWSNAYYSDGLKTRYVLPPFLTPRYSTGVNQKRWSPV